MGNIIWIFSVLDVVVVSWFVDGLMYGDVVVDIVDFVGEFIDGLK